MKFLVIFYLALPVFSGAQSSQTFSVDVRIKKGIREGKAFLRYFTEEGPYLDSASFSNGMFRFEGKMPSKPTIARIHILEKTQQEPIDENKCELWLEPGSILIRTEKKLSQAKYDGSESQLQFSELQEELLPVREKTAVLNAAYEKAEAEKDADRKDKLLNEEYPELFLQKQKLLGKFIGKYPGSLLSAFMFDDFAGEGQMDLSIVEPVYKVFPDDLKKHPLVDKVAKRMAICKRTSPGMEAIDFEQKDTSGVAIRLSSFRGKYLLIDFWAGWCIPCRAENPHLRKLYSQYKNQGFEILGVSLDGERKRWTGAIINDKLSWPQTSDLNIFDNSVAKLYGINSIPQNILIGPDGKILSWNLRSKKLDDKLRELFPKQN